MTLQFDQKKITYDEYLTWGEGIFCEALDGSIINMSPAPTPKHQAILRELLTDFSVFLRGKECNVFGSQIDVCLFSEKETTYKNIKDWVQPDLVVVCDKRKIDEKRIIGAPDLVIEILSPSTSKNDRVLKYSKYEKAGIKEYWIVDPYNEFIEVYLLDNKVYKQKGSYFKSDLIPVSIFDKFEIDLSNIFQQEEE
ncbi:Uma2 family endonuclease [Metabacillus herbersteinensis]|uniref:Uma2 family endonuclease n=1 Tax=Metabacillus herbersteinensis TaxID=283816 RepID=A0ABV6GM81_9BACI